MLRVPERQMVGAPRVAGKVGAMSAIETRSAQAIRPVPTPPGPAEAGDTDVVAVVLGDGTVRPVGGGSDPVGSAWEWQTGRISGRNWILWWERRRWPAEPAPAIPAAAPETRGPAAA